MASLLLEDIFEVEDLNPGGKKLFEKVDRLKCRSQQQELELQLDVNCEVYPEVCLEGAAFSLALAPTLSLDGAPDSGSFDQSGEKNLAENYDYVMHGQLFKIEAAGAGKVAATASFGGLLMLLTGDKRSLGELALDQKLYLLMRRV